ncbi:unnamed protein product [Trichobilharzia szidati]|nr:unnamed protein product [Trichobilharzia szidati]
MSLRKPAPFIVSTDERKKKKEEIQDKNVDMVSLTQLIGQKLLFQGKPEEAVPAALQCLKFTADAYGLASVELVSPYLILAESSIGLGRLNQAETYLAQAQWTILKTQHECSNGIRSQLHRKLGLLYAAKGDYELALESLAKDIFYASCEYGTDHIRTAGGYFQMAEVFYAMHQRDKNNENLINQESSDKPSTYVYPSVTPRSLGMVSTGKTYGSFLCEEATKHDVNLSKNSEFSVQMPMSKAPVADDLYARVVNIWAAYLGELVESLLYKPVIPEGIGAVVAEITQETKQTLDDAQKAEAEKMLYAIEKYRQQRISEDGTNAIMHNPVRPDPKVRLYLTLSMLNYVLERKQKAIQYLAEAKVAAEHAPEHPKIKADINLMERALEEKTQTSCIKVSQ